MRTDRIVIGLWSAGFALLLYLTLGLTFQFSGYGEGLYDLHYVAAGWVDGGWPTPELWRPGAVVQHYYHFGLAGWGQLGAWYGLSLGATYVLGLILFPTLVFGLVLAAAQGSWLLRAVTALVATFPASGISLWLGLGFVELPSHLVNMGHVRLVEWGDRAGDSVIGQALVTGAAYPLESLAHLVLELQNLHPPVMGFALLALLLVWYLRLSPQPSRFDGLWPGLILVLGYAVNAWMLPMLVGTVLAMLILRRSGVLLLGTALGALLTIALLWWPYFRHFDPPDAVRVTLLAAEHRSAWGSWLLIWLPYLLATAWWFIALRVPRIGGLHVPSALALLPLVFLAAVLSLEVVHLDDPYGDNYERFNSVLKTGSLAMAGWAMSLLVLASRGRWRLWLPILLLLGVPSALQLQGLAAKLGGQMHRANWSLAEPQMIGEEDYRALFAALRGQPRGTTLEFTESTAYTSVPMVSTLLAWPTWSGWASHLGQVGTFTAEDWATRDALQQWYRRYPPDNTVLDTNAVDYVLVPYAVRWRNAQIAERQAALGVAWEWVGVAQHADGRRAGFFRRRFASGPDAPG
ncbi:MAG: hypothetical protein ABF296_01770 [Oceanococcaceae bacterium]